MLARVTRPWGSTMSFFSRLFRRDQEDGDVEGDNTSASGNATTSEMRTVDSDSASSVASVVASAPPSGVTHAVRDTRAESNDGKSPQSTVSYSSLASAANAAAR